MRGIINNIINFYDTETKILDVLITNTQKALEQSEKERKANEQVQRVEKFVKDLTMDLNNMLTRFYWLKERKKRRHEEMTSEQVNAMVNFAHFVKSLTEKVHSVLEYFQKSPTFAEKVDRDMKELEAHIKAQLKRFNEVLEETPDTLAICLSKYADTLSGAVRKFFTHHGFSILKSNKVTHTKQPEGLPYNDKEEISTPIASFLDEHVENLIYSLSGTTAKHRNVKSKYQTYSKI
jgi:exonuclease VII large subunit